MRNENLKLKVVKKIKKNIVLKSYTTFKIGGRAKYFLEAGSKEEIIEAIKWAKKKAMPFFVLGGGSNLLIDDRGFKGLVIKLQTTNYKLQTNNIVYAESGVKLSDLINLSLKEGLSGFEWAAGIPGITVGGAVRGNAGAFGKQISDIVEEVRVFDGSQFKIKNLNLKDCAFDYKESVFKKNKNLIILSVAFLLKNKNKDDIKKEINCVLNYRKAKHPFREPSAGCVFKNESLKNKELLNKFPELKRFQPQGSIPAAYLIERCGLKGKTIGGAQISRKHANFIVNLGEATSKDIIKLISLSKKKVKRKFGILLEEEIQYLKPRNSEQHDLLNRVSRE